ncbi:methyltransferase domain-containing protein [Pseudomonas sp. BCA14]|uniref:class I SAM-dependent methyltransferase n=1 Tax=unclassified Pseudomonas TaxID=196821 RepID=UPI00106DEA6D|nr:MULTISPECIES: class I SAM-dependent methyltransferase [unclassified Pseudomonas]TFF06092.1 methyltransferase domain-containing protein [Pseudomonas sp. JMN1]TFF08345.1 methyltransferase domain-containing protein [Pseudomonas sp. BCA17]TFF23741.1 methyltransferase domain-containing protein [Pseudomonas sp. BCA14]TFF27991.1 methyltransferase domain-containing protein [Pseudomonas sp. BCA13]
MKTTLAILTLTALLLPVVSQAADAQISARQYSSVLAGSWRDPANSARDGYRHPQQTLEFFGLRANQRVIEITPGGGWYSEVLAPLLKDHGQYIAAVQAASSSAYARISEENLKKKFTADPARYGKAAVVEFDPKAPVFGKPASADAVLTFRNVHNWVAADTAAATFSAFYNVLKPGGVLGVEDHRAKDGADLEAIKNSGYLTTAQVVKLATDAGFQLAGQSEVNANPKDTKDYPDGVWTLPPTLKLGEQDKARYLAIGESDRMTLRFVKPTK